MKNFPSAICKWDMKKKLNWNVWTWTKALPSGHRFKKCQKYMISHERGMERKLDGQLWSSVRRPSSVLHQNKLEVSNYFFDGFAAAVPLPLIHPLLARKKDGGVSSGLENLMNSDRSHKCEKGGKKCGRKVWKITVYWSLAGIYCWTMRGDPAD